MESLKESGDGRMGQGTLQMESVSPLYAQIMERIRMDILQGIYPVGSKIPTEHELEVRYTVSRVTVRRALQELTAAGLLQRKQGKGTFVSQPREERKARTLMGFHDACRETGKKPSVQKLRVRELDAAPEDRKRLNLPEDAQVLEIRRVLAADGEPVILEQNHFSMAYAWLENASLRGSLYRALQEYGVQAEKSIYDLSLVAADAEETALLQVAEGTTLLLAEQVVYDQKGRPLYTGRQLIRGDRYTLRI